jgi:uncharacterized delta-60 repeat protein
MSVFRSSAGWGCSVGERALNAKAAVMLVAFATLGVGPAWAAAGDLDPNFGNGGIVLTDLGNVVASATVAQQDGKIVVAVQGIRDRRSGRSEFALVRYDSKGKIDKQFGHSGLATTLFADDAQITDLAIQGDGRIVAAGFTEFFDPGAGTTTRGDFALARYLQDGSLDVTFGSNGLVTTDFAQGLDVAFAVTIRNDGRILAAGETSAYAQGPSHCAVSRYNPGGTLDTTFGQGGLVTASAGTECSATGVVARADGRSVVSGSMFDTGHIVVFQFNPDGTADLSFDGDGQVFTNFGSPETGRDLLLQPNGDVVVVGGSNGAFLAARYHVDGSVDATFGDRRVNVSTWANSASLQPDGKIVLAGVLTTTVEQFAVARLNSDGSMDGTFGTGGVVYTEFLGGANGHPVPSPAEAHGVTILQDGRIVAAGGTAAPDFDVALAAYVGQ